MRNGTQPRIAEKNESANPHRGKEGSVSLKRKTKSGCSPLHIVEVEK